MTIFDRFLSVINHQESYPVPVSGWDNAIPITRMAKLKAKNYYRDANVKFLTQKMVLDQFPQIRWVPGFHADYGTIIEASALGCHIEWFEDEAPHAHPCLNSIHDVSKIRLPDPMKDGLMPEALDQLKYIWQQIEPKYIEEYGYLEGFALCLGPMEIAGHMCGYEKLFLELFDHPKSVHKLLEIITDCVLLWLKAQEEVNGKISFLIMIDHLPANLSLQMFDEFCFPYFKNIFDQYPDAIRLYHNEGKSDHYLTKIPEFGANVFHCGFIDLPKAKNLIGDQLCFMGNLDANNILLNGTPLEVKQKCIDLLKTAAPGGGYILCTGGAMAPETPEENILSMVEASLDYERQFALT